MSNFFKTVSVFYKNKFVSPEVATIKHCIWQIRKLLDLFPCDIAVHDFKVRISNRSIANGCGALINAMGYYDPNNMHLLDELFSINLLRSFFDIGANIGIYSLIAASTRNVKVFAFEPHPYTLSLLRENIAINFFEKRVNAVQCALGELNGQINLTDNPGSAVNHILENNENAQKGISVKQIRGDTFCQEENIIPHAMKIDVEGYENSVLRGFESILDRVQLIFVECRSVAQTCSILCDRFGFLGPYKIDYRARRFEKADISYEDWNFVNPQLLPLLESANFQFERNG